MKFSKVKIEKPDDDFTVNVIIGVTHFIKSVEDIHEALVNTVPGIKFGLAFLEASGPKLIRVSSTDKEMAKLAVKNAKLLKTGHVFIIFLKDCFPINVLRSIKQVPEVCRILCATANPVEVVVAETGQGRGVMGVIDGEGTEKVETTKDKKERMKFLRKIGYKF
ncbi:MAG: adenosine-specific kinase [Candidatus Dojkabacteria bacterium]|nr:adenosine-specific kinase [Candidatus Dojkabacteria bacterium]